MPLESANMPRDDGRLTWMAAARMGDIKLLELYFSEGVDVNEVIKSGSSAPMSDGVEEYLRQSNAIEGFTALLVASTSGDPEIVRMLEDAGRSAKGKSGKRGRGHQRGRGRRG